MERRVFRRLLFFAKPNLIALFFYGNFYNTISDILKQTPNQKFTPTTQTTKSRKFQTKIHLPIDSQNPNTFEIKIQTKAHAGNNIKSLQPNLNPQTQEKKKNEKEEEES